MVDENEMVERSGTGDDRSSGPVFEQAVVGPDFLIDFGRSVAVIDAVVFQKRIHFRPSSEAQHAANLRIR